MLDSGLHPAGNTLESHACMGMRHGVVKQHGDANPCAYRTALKDVAGCLGNATCRPTINRLFRVLDEELP